MPIPLKNRNLRPFKEFRYCHNHCFSFLLGLIHRVNMKKNLIDEFGRKERRWSTQFFPGHPPDMNGHTSSAKILSK